MSCSFDRVYVSGRRPAISGSQTSTRRTPTWQAELSAHAVPAAAPFLRYDMSARAESPANEGVPQASPHYDAEDLDMYDEPEVVALDDVVKPEVLLKMLDRVLSFPAVRQKEQKELKTQLLELRRSVEQVLEQQRQGAASPIILIGPEAAGKSTLGNQASPAITPICLVLFAGPFGI